MLAESLVLLLLAVYVVLVVFVLDMFLWICVCRICFGVCSSFWFKCIFERCLAFVVLDVCFGGADCFCFGVGFGCSFFVCFVNGVWCWWFVFVVFGCLWCLLLISV